MLTSQQLKEDGMQLAFDYAGVDFKEALPSVLQQWCAKLGKKAEFRVEQLREWALNTQALPEPKSPNAWGKVPARARALGLIEYAGRHEPSTSLKTHGHDVKVWRVL
jgi:hypothetical protein